MMVEKDQDLGLSLRLGSPSSHHPPLQLNLMPSLRFPSSAASVSSPSSACNNINISQKPSWINDVFPSSGPNCDSSRPEARSFLRGIDVNRLPSSAVDPEEEAGVSSPTSTISRVSGKRNERELGIGSEEHENDRACSRGISDEEDGDASRKKLRLTKDQSAVLEDSFKENNTLNPVQAKDGIGQAAGAQNQTSGGVVQNRRARTKLKQTEVDCEFLKRCCENLTEENRRLQKEVQELRALKLSPQFYMQMTPPTTLTMCPSCERVGVPPSPSAPPQASGDARARHPQMGPPPHHRPMPINPWAPAVSFDALRPRA